MRFISLVALVVASSLAAAAQPGPRSNPDARPTAYVGGQWWDGARFVARDTTWAERGVFVDARPAIRQPDKARVVELADRFVVPPFGDAHTHMLSDAYSAGLADELFLDRGIYYALVLTNPGNRANALRERFNRPDRLDVAYAHGGLTTTGSHPAPLYERVWQNEGADSEAARSDTTAWSGHRIVYWFLDDLEDLDAEWDAYLAQRPDAVKIYLTYNQRCDELPTSRNCGLRPGVAAAVVQRAHAAGLPVFAHVNTVDDVHRAIDAGVDALAHLPSGNDGIPVADDRFWLDDDAIARLAASGTTVVPTASLLTEDLDAFRTDTLQAEVGRQREELRRLHAAGVPIALGADAYFESSRREAAHLEAYGTFDAATLLGLWGHVTPQTVFPGRAVGELAAGYEASLLALACDPTADWTCTAQIAHREKQGTDLDLEDTADAWRQLDVDTFTAPARPTDGPLLRGLKALADADFAAADNELATALAAAPDSLRPFVRARLAESAREQFRWADAVAWTRIDDPSVDGSHIAGHARAPASRLQLDVPETTVPFDGLRVPATVGGVDVQAIVDTGAAGTSLPRQLVERLGLRVDTTAKGRSVVPSLGLAFDTYAVQVDSLRVGDALFLNVPASVSAREDESSEDGGNEIFLGASLLRHLAGAVRYDYVDSTFTIVRDVARTEERPQFLIDLGTGAPVVPVSVAGQASNAVLDTGNQAPVYLAEGAFELANYPVVRTATGTLSNGHVWTQSYRRVPLQVPGHPEAEHEAYEAVYIFPKGYRIQVILGKTVWASGTLSIDFVNRRATFEPATPDDELATDTASPEAQ